MTVQAWLIYLMLVIIATFTPGAAVAFIMAHSARSWLSTPKRVQAIQRTGGALFVGLGVLLATASHR